MSSGWFTIGGQFKRTVWNFLTTFSRNWFLNLFDLTEEVGGWGRTLMFRYRKCHSLDMKLVLRNIQFRDFFHKSFYQDCTWRGNMLLEWLQPIGHSNQATMRGCSCLDWADDAAPYFYRHTFLMAQNTKPATISNWAVSSLSSLSFCVSRRSVASV